MRMKMPLVGYIMDKRANGPHQGRMDLHVDEIEEPEKEYLENGLELSMVETGDDKPLMAVIELGMDEIRLLHAFLTIHIQQNS